MRKWRLVTLVVMVTGLVVPVASDAARPAATVPSVTSVYTVGALTVPGVDTGLMVGGAMSVTATATGAVCPFGGGFCVGPDGYSLWDTTQSSYGGFVLPGAPAWGLVARVGSGPWVTVGSGPTTLSGTGDLVFAVNDDMFRDNTGSFTVTVTVSYACFPGWGYGDANHPHAGPPGLLDTCYPGHGYGDVNHLHAGPPGHLDVSSVTSEGGKKSGPPHDDPHGSDGPGKSQSRGNQNR